MMSGSDHGILLFGLAHPFEISGIVPGEVLSIYEAYVALLYRQVKVTGPKD